MVSSLLRIKAADGAAVPSVPKDVGISVSALASLSPEPAMQEHSDEVQHKALAGTGAGPYAEGACMLSPL